MPVLQSGNDASVAAPKSKNRRCLEQTLELLVHLDELALLDFEITFSKLEKIYKKEIQHFDKNIPFIMIYYKLREKKLVTTRHRSNTAIFNIEKIGTLFHKELSYASACLLNIERPVQNDTQQRVDGLAGTSAGGANTTTGRKKRRKPPVVNQNRAFRLNETSNAQATRPQTARLCCVECTSKFSSDKQLAIHRKTDEHLFTVAYQSCNRNTLSSNDKQPPASVSGTEQGITVNSVSGEEGRKALKVNMLLKNRGTVLTKDVQLLVTCDLNEDLPPLFLERTFLAFENPGAQILENKAPTEPLQIGRTITRTLRLTQGQVCASTYIVVFKFVHDPADSSKPMFVMKQIEVRVDNEATAEDGVKIETLPSVRQHQLPQIVMEPRPLTKARNKLKVMNPLDEYEIPENFISFFNLGFESNPSLSPEMELKKAETLETLVHGLNIHNYSRYMAILLYLEEHQLLCDLKTYSMKDAPLTRYKSNKQLVALDVPGLAEKRPSVLRGDTITFTYQNGDVLEYYKGQVKSVLNTQLAISMGQAFMKKFIDNMRVNVHFTFNRFSIRTEHRALELIGNQVERVCFPSSFGKYTKNKPIMSWINGQVRDNPEQARAVQNIINGTSLPSAYLVFGPPGTGKTITIVETMQQIFFSSETTRILAAAPSNSAADLLAERLLKSVPASKLLRMYSPSRDWNTVPIELHNCTNFKNDNVFFPSMAELMKYRILVVTLICAGRLVSGDCPEGHFDYIFIDECGHGMEPTSLVPIAGLLSPEPNPGQLVFAGDPRQLGPIIRSPVAKKMGLSLSLLERMMLSCDLYKKQEDTGHYNPQVLTKLVRNFRSHPDILKVPNELYYDNELEPHGDHGKTHLACNWEELPKKGVPIIFHGIEGKDEQDEGSPSFFNIAEVNLVVEYVKKVLDAKFCGMKLKPSDIGIISPYRRQINKLHRALERSKLTGLSLGSVEEFQGQERAVIIMTAVRSNPANLKLDRKFRLGFIKEPKRFNVAITRARSLLIVVGNPNILQHDTNWRRLLEWAHERGAYTGCRFNLRPTEDALLPIDPDDLRVPVDEKLQKHLDETKQALEIDHTQVTDAEITQRLADMALAAGPSTVSDLELQVSPPLTYSEQ